MVFPETLDVFNYILLFLKLIKDLKNILNKKHKIIYVYNLRILIIRINSDLTSKKKPKINMKHCGRNSG